MRPLAVVCSFLLLLGPLGCTSPQSNKGINNNQTADAKAEVWIDVRTAEEYQAGHVDAAINIPYDEIANDIAALQLAPDQPIYLYCRSGRRAGIALETLAGLGYTRVTNVGGLEDAQQWIAQSGTQD